MTGQETIDFLKKSKYHKLTIEITTDTTEEIEEQLQGVKDYVDTHPDLFGKKVVNKKTLAEVLNSYAQWLEHVSWDRCVLESIANNFEQEETK